MLIQYYTLKCNKLFYISLLTFKENNILNNTMGLFSCNECEWIVPGTIED